MLSAILDYIKAIILQTPYIEEIDGVAELVRDANGKTVPMVAQASGEMKEVTFFDLKRGHGYFRKNGDVTMTREVQPSNTPGKNFQVIGFPLRLVLAIPKKLLTDNSFTNVDLAQSMSALINSDSAELRKIVGAKRALIQVLRYQTDRERIFRAEYPGIDHNRIPLDFAYVALNLSISITIPMDCLNLLCDTDIDILHFFNFCDNVVFNRLTAAQIQCLTDQLCNGPTEATVNVNGGLFSNVNCGDTLNVPVKNTAGTELGSKVGSNWEIADITFTDTDNTKSSKISGVDISATLIPDLSCGQLNEKDDGLTTAQRQLIQRVNPLKTGQTASYRTGDDGDLEKGRLSAFLTLDCANPFGNTNRFTDDAGGTTYANDLVLDWATMLMWYRIWFTGVSWNDAIDNSQSSMQGGYSDWRVPNGNEIVTIVQWDLGDPFNYAPFNKVLGDNCWLSTTKPSDSADAYIYNDGGNTRFNVASEDKTITRDYNICRNFTLTDVGL